MNLDFISIKMLHNVYFELFGRKMKHTVSAPSKEEAQYEVKLFILSRIVFFDNVPKDEKYNVFGFLQDVVNGKK